MILVLVSGNLLCMIFLVCIFRYASPELPLSVSNQKVSSLEVVRMVKWPYQLTKSIMWWSKYLIRRIKKLEYNDEERETLTISAVGQVAWVAASEEDRAKMLNMDLWVTDNLVAWKEEQEMNLTGLSATKKKQLKKYLKKKGVNLENAMYDDKMD